MDRKKVNSATELIKIIAQEVVDNNKSENYLCLSKRVSDLEGKMIKIENIIKPLSNPFNGGDKWKREDDEKLTLYTSKFICLMAKKLNRSTRSIQCRIKPLL
jgi:hypothetical protein